MRTLLFKHNDQAYKQHEIARYIVNQLRTYKQFDFPCDCKEAVQKLAQLVQMYDPDRLIAIIEIHENFIRLKRNEKGAFAFDPVVMDFNKHEYRVGWDETPVK